MSQLKKILRNVISNWANLIVSLVISFFLAPFILNKIGNVYFGVWVLVTQITGYLWLLDFGVRESVIKYVAEYNEKKDNKLLGDIIESALRMYALVCFICIAVSLCLALLLPVIFSISHDVIPTARLVVIISGIDIALAFVFNIFVGILMGMQRYDLFSTVSIGISIIRAILTVAFLSQGYGIVALALIQLFLNVCTNVIIYFAARRSLTFRLNVRHVEKRRWIYKMLFNYGFFVLLNNVCYMVCLHGATLIIAIFLPVSAVTFYAIAANLIEYMKKIIFAGTQVFNPLTSQLDARNETDKITTLLIQGTKFSLLLGLPVATVYFIMGRQFIGLWMGAEYSDIAGQVLAVLTVMTLFSLPHYTVISILLGLNKHKITAYCRLIEAVANIGLSVLLIKQFGIIGVAYGAAVPHVIMVIFVFPVIISRIVGITLSEYVRNAYFGPLFAGVPFAVACYFASFNYTSHSLLAFFSEVIVLLPIYMIGVWFVAFTRKERNFCKERLFAMVPVTLGR